MILTLNITEDSKVELLKDGCEAVQGEHNVTILNINFPTTIKGYSIDNYAKQIEFAECKELGECVKFLDVLEGNTYKLCSTCTQFEKLMIQFTLKNLVDEAEPIVWKTIPFMLEFCESINAENNKEVQVTLLSLAEIKAEWETFVKSNTLRMIYKVSDVPTPDATSLGDTIFYLGANATEPYTLTYGHYYRCNYVNKDYEWTDLTNDPNLADVANGIREINNNQTMQFWVGTEEELENEVTQTNTLYIKEENDFDRILKTLTINKKGNGEYDFENDSVKVGDILEIEFINSTLSTRQFIKMRVTENVNSALVFKGIGFDNELQYYQISLTTAGVEIGEWYINFISGEMGMTATMQDTNIVSVCKFIE